MSAPPCEPAPLTRAWLDTAPRQLLNRGNRRNPDVLLVEYGGRMVVVKDFAPRAAWVRVGLGRWITAREVRALRALDGHPAIPALVQCIDPLAFAVEYRPGRRMSRKLAEVAPADFVDRLGEALAEMHRRGVAHLDLRHRSNVMMSDDGEPVLIDFGSAITFRPGSRGARGLLPVLAWIDRRALAKWRVRLSRPSAPPGRVQP